MARRKQFAALLTKGVRQVAINKNKTIGIVQDELGFALGRNGGTAIEYWRKGHIPANLSDIEMLSAELVRHDGLRTRQELVLFLRSADYLDETRLCSTLFPDSSLTPTLAPFVVGPPILYPKQFFGRHYESKRIFALLKRLPLQHVAIIGAGRSGKTSLLHYIKKITTTTSGERRPTQKTNWLPDPKPYRWGFVDFQNPRMHHPEALFSHLLTELDMPIQQTNHLDDFIEIINNHLHHPAIIMMDDIGAGLAAPALDQAFWWSLRSLSSNFTNGLLSFILTSSHIPNQLAQQYGKPSPFFNIFGHTFTLGPLTPPEARELIYSSPLPFAARDRDWILTQSQRWPNLLQILCHTRLMGLEEGITGDKWRREGLAQMAGAHPQM